MFDCKQFKFVPAEKFKRQPEAETKREDSLRAHSTNKMKQIGLAMHNFHDSHRRFPARAERIGKGNPLLSWRVHILPLVGQVKLYKQFHFDEPWDSPHNKKLIEKMPAVFRSHPPARPRQT